MEKDHADEINVESEVHSFVVRMWLEEVESRRVAWHGQIAYVRNGELRYFKTLNEISDFIRTRLQLNDEL